MYFILFITDYICYSIRVCENEELIRKSQFLFDRNFIPMNERNNNLLSKLHRVFISSCLIDLIELIKLNEITILDIMMYACFICTCIKKNNKIK